MMIGIYFGLLFLYDGKKSFLTLSFLFMLLGAMSKIPALYLMPIYLLPLLDKSVLCQRKIALMLASIPIALPVWWWYFHWNYELTQASGIWYNTGKSLGEGIHDIFTHLPATAKRFYFDGLCAYTGFAAFVAGIILSLFKKDKKVLWVFAVLTASFILYIFKAGFFFHHHTYYILPYVPVMALMAGSAIDAIKENWARTTVIVLISAEAIANQQNDLRLRKKEVYKMELENIADKTIPKNALVIINGGENPQEIYLTHRKGWTVNSDQLQDRNLIQNCAKKGAKYIIQNTKALDNQLPYEVVDEESGYRVYKIIPSPI